jgi:hypothetical protein
MKEPINTDEVVIGKEMRAQFQSNCLYLSGAYEWQDCFILTKDEALNLQIFLNENLK